jgi:hypothetical protein
MSITYCVCVSVILSNQHAMHMRHMACPALQYFPHYLVNGTIFGGMEGGGVTEHKMCVLIFSTTFV